MESTRDSFEDERPRGLKFDKAENSSVNFKQMEIVDFVAKPTWKEFLLELISSEQLNPWDIDLVDVAEKYLNAVRQLQALDLRIPANVILASSLLLRFKSEALSLEEEPVVFEEAPEEFVPIQEEIPELMRRGIVRSRKMTLDELISAIDKVISDDFTRPIISKPAKLLNIVLPEQDMHDTIKKVYDKLLAKKDSANMLLFSDLLEEETNDNFVFYLLPVLHLMQDERVFLWQDEMFGEIFIRIVLNEKDKGITKEPELLALMKNRPKKVVDAANGAEVSISNPAVQAGNN